MNTVPSATATADSAATAVLGPLTRPALAAWRGGDIPLAPVRIVHIGLGAFARAHQAWYTSQVDEAGEWGIAAFTGRSATAAAELAPQGGLFSVIERSATADQVGIVGSITEVNDGADVARLVELLAAPHTAIVTLTVTESGYRLRADGSLNLSDPVVAHDVSLLEQAHGAVGSALVPASPESALARLVLGLDARFRADAGPIAVVPCDNMPDNGAFVRRGVLELAGRIGADTATWIEQNVSFVSTSVDRITPRTTPDDVAAVTELTGWVDASPVVTEPFHDWALSGEFPGGRPEWERAGARFVADIEPFERRKLWLLNGAHSLLAYTGLLRGHATVAGAMADPATRAEVRELWSEAARHLPQDGLDLESYCAALLERFDNARIEHQLAQIAAEGVTKLRVRFVPVARAERAAGRPATASAVAIGGWIELLLGGRELVDAQRGAVEEALSATDPEHALLALLDRELAADVVFLDGVRAARRSFR